ncbi:MAG TPA: hypothetical protein VKD46_08230, partial [bacterium]|nr:hypothetical protein [bacterium]
MSRRYRPFDPFEREGPARDFPMPPISRRFWSGVAVLVLAVVVFVAASPIVSFITEVEWYDSLGLRDVYLTR